MSVVVLLPSSASGRPPDASARDAGDGDGRLYPLDPAGADRRSVDPGTEIERIVFESEGGVVVPPDDFDSFILKLEELIENFELLEEMGKKARIWLENCYSSKTVADFYLDLIRRLNP